MTMRLDSGLDQHMLCIHSVEGLRLPAGDPVQVKFTSDNGGGFTNAAQVTDKGKAIFEYVLRIGKSKVLSANLDALTLSLLRKDRDAVDSVTIDLDALSSKENKVHRYKGKKLTFNVEMLSSESTSEKDFFGLVDDMPQDDIVLKHPPSSPIWQKLSSSSEWGAKTRPSGSPTFAASGMPRNPRHHSPHGSPTMARLSLDAPNAPDNLSFNSCFGRQSSQIITSAARPSTPLERTKSFKPPGNPKFTSPFDSPPLSRQSSTLSSFRTPRSSPLSRQKLARQRSSIVNHAQTSRESVGMDGMQMGFMQEDCACSIM